MIQGGPSSSVSQMGASVIIENVKPENNIENKLNYVEFRNMGQSNKLGRHPIRFFSEDDMTGATSFTAIGNVIHNSWNRGIALSGTTNAMIKENLLFGVRGHSIFNEYAHERNNTIESNSVVSTKKAFNLLDSDL